MYLRFILPSRHSKLKNIFLTRLKVFISVGSRPMIKEKFDFPSITEKSKKLLGLVALFYYREKNITRGIR